MPISKINTSGIADNAVISSKIAQDIVLAEDIANNAITVNELANNAVTTDKILDGTIVTADLANDCVTIDKLANNSVGADQIVDNSITLGTHTTGNYMLNIQAAGGSNGLTITHTQGEGSTAIINYSPANDSITLGTHTTGEYIYRLNTTFGTNAISVHQYGGGPVFTNTNSEAFNAELRLSSNDNIFTNQMIKAGQFVETHSLVSYSSGTNDFSLDVSSNNSFKVILTQNSDILFTNVPTGLSDTQVWTLTIQQGSSNYSVVYPTNVHWPNGQKPTLSSASGAIDQFVFLKTGNTGSGGAIYGFTVGQDIKAPASP